MGMVARQFEVYLINLDPTLGSEIRKTRPCVVISPNEMNGHFENCDCRPGDCIRRA
jgi:mRNA interferase MazF